MTLHSHIFTRIFLGVVLPGLTLTLAWMFVQRGTSAWLVAMSLVIGAIVSWRGYRMGATCTDSALVVRGFLLTRTIPKSEITSITHQGARSVPGVWWRDGNGTSNWVYLSAFTTSDSRAMRRWSVAQMAKIVAWSGLGDAS